ncbi:spore germination protein [Fictibacillus sp. UD]|uniref:spore germination protein n=1 Tax=Fictibacillus sp. UD TaxID=3038777 RepID=UPI0037454A79
MKFIHRKENTKITELLSWFTHSTDVVVKKDLFAEKAKSTDYTLMFCKGLVDVPLLEKILLPFLNDVFEQGDANLFHSLEKRFVVHEIKIDAANKLKIEHSLFSGQVLLIGSENHSLYAINLANTPKRTPEESNTEISIRGARDGFIEDIEINFALIRKRLKTSSLNSKAFTIGKRSQTAVSLLFIEDIIDPDLVVRVEQRLSKIDIDALVSSSELEEELSDSVFSIFPLLDNTGRPDFAVQSLIQGRFVIIVDGSPTVLIGPSSLAITLKSPEDAHASFYMVSFERFLRFTGLFTTVTLPGLWVALTTFHPDQLPYPLLATLTLSRTGLPLSLPLEMMIMVVLFELFKEAGARLPRAVGQTVAVLGGLIVGDAAIRAGLTSPTTLVVVAITMIASYTFVNQSLSGNLLFLRIYTLIMCATFGLFGFFIAMLSIFLLVSSLRSFDYPYLESFASPNAADTFKTFFKAPFTLMKKRSSYLFPKDSTRQGNSNEN